MEPPHGKRFTLLQHSCAVLHIECLALEAGPRVRLFRARVKNHVPIAQPRAVLLFRNQQTHHGSWDLEHLVLLATIRILYRVWSGADFGAQAFPPPSMQNVIQISIFRLGGFRVIGVATRRPCGNRDIPLRVCGSETLSLTPATYGNDEGSSWWRS